MNDILDKLILLKIEILNDCEKIIDEKIEKFMSEIKSPTLKAMNEDDLSSLSDFSSLDCAQNSSGEEKNITPMRAIIKSDRAKVINDVNKMQIKKQIEQISKYRIDLSSPPDCDDAPVKSIHNILNGSNIHSESYTYNKDDQDLIEKFEKLPPVQTKKISHIKQPQINQKSKTSMFSNLKNVINNIDSMIKNLP